MECPTFLSLVYFSLSFRFAPLQIQAHKLRLRLNCSLCKNHLQVLLYYQTQCYIACRFYPHRWQNRLFYLQICFSINRLIIRFLAFLNSKSLSHMAYNLFNHNLLLSGNTIHHSFEQNDQLYISKTYHFNTKIFEHNLKGL